MVPIVHASNLAALIAYYRGVLRFRVLQEIPAVYALVQHAGIRLQLWQRTGLRPRECRIDLDAGTGCIFDVHSRMSRVARSAIVEDDGPAATPWGTWEFTLCDCQGNRLVFSEPLPFDAAGY